MYWIESGRNFFPLVWGFCNALGLVQNPTWYGSIHSASQMVAWFLLWLLLSWRLAPVNFLYHQLSLVETASKSSWDLHSDNLVVERMGPVGRHIIFFPAILLLALSSFSSAMSPLFPLESLPQYIASKHLQDFQDSLNSSYSQDGGWDSYPAGPFPASVHRDLAPWLP